MILAISICLLLVSLSNGEDALQYHFSYSTGTDSPAQIFRQEQKSVDGIVTGKYGYVDPNGQLRVVNYQAGPDGYTATGDIGPDQETLRIAKELAEQDYRDKLPYLQHWNEIAARTTDAFSSSQPAKIIHYSPQWSSLQGPVHQVSQSFDNSVSYSPYAPTSANYQQAGQSSQSYDSSLNYSPALSSSANYQSSPAQQYSHSYQRSNSFSPAMFTSTNYQSSPVQQYSRSYQRSTSYSSGPSKTNDYKSSLQQQQLSQTYQRSTDYSSSSQAKTANYQSPIQQKQHSQTYQRSTDYSSSSQAKTANYQFPIQQQQISQTYQKSAKSYSSPVSYKPSNYLSQIQQVSEKSYSTKSVNSNIEQKPISQQNIETDLSSAKLQAAPSNTGNVGNAHTYVAVSQGGPNGYNYQYSY